MGDIVVFAPPSDGPKIPLSKEQTYLVLGADNVAGVVELNGGWIIPGGYLFHANDDQKAKMIATWVAEKPLPPIKKFKVTHDRSEIPQVFNIGDKVSFRGKMYFVKYVNPEDHMVQIELAKIRHGKVTGVVTGAIVNVKPDTILPWGSKPNNKAIQVGGDEWNKNTAVRLEYDYAKVSPLLNQIAEDLVEVIVSWINYQKNSIPLTRPRARITSALRPSRDSCRSKGRLNCWSSGAL